MTAESATRRALAALLTAAVVVAGCGSSTPSTGSTLPSTASSGPLASSAAIASPAPDGSAATSAGSTGIASARPASPAIVTPAPLHPVAVSIAPFRLPQALSRSVAVALGGATLICGGFMASGTTTGDVLLFDPAGRLVTRIGRLAAPVHDAAGTTVGSRAFVFGGGSVLPETTVQLVDPLGGSRVVGRLPLARADLAAVVVGGQAIVVGGGTSAGPDRAVLATTDGIHFRRIATLAVGVRYPAVAVSGGRVFVIGGATPTGDVATIQSIDPATGTVRVVGHLPFALSHAVALVVGGELLIAGGRRAGVPLRTLFALDPGRGVVREVGQLPYRVSDAAAIVVGGVGYIVGGEAATQLATIIVIRPG
ncbi:MAG: Kelch repeat-containing protein [Candidatus Limnocylindrales bacterium]